MSVCDPDGGMHSMWVGQWTPQVFADVPPARGATEQERARYLAHFDSLIDASVAAIIVEPVVQGAGGMCFHDHELLVGLREICDNHGILLIADEIATGFGRAGDLFTTQAAGVVPDIMCVGKALTGGFMSFAATLATATAAAVSQGVWLRPFGKLVYTMPPYISTNDEVDCICAAIAAVAAAEQQRGEATRQPIPQQFAAPNNPTDNSTDN